MAKLQSSFNFGDKNDLNLEELVDRLQDMYSDLADAVNQKPDVFFRDDNGAASDTFLSNGSINVNTDTQRVEMLTEHTNPSTVIWTTLS